MKALILLHGWGAGGDIWQRQAAAFGHLLPVLTPTIPTWEAGWVSAYLQELPLETNVVVGWSLGGMLLLEALAGLGAAPASLVLVGVAATFCRRPDHPWGQNPAAVRAMRRGLKDDPRKVLRDFASSCLAPGEEPFLGEAAAFFGAPAYLENLGPGLDYLLNQDLRGRLHQTTGRPTIIQGEEDRIVPPAQALFLKDQIPGARLYLLKGAGHLPFLTQTAAFNKILQELLVREG